MASDVRTTINALVTLLQGVTGGSYTIDLAPAGAIRVGAPNGATTGTVCWVGVNRVDSERSAEIGSWSRVLLLDIWVFVPASGGDPESKTWAAVDALDDITTRLQTSPAIGSALDSNFTGTTFDGADLKMPGMAVANISWRGWWISTSGEGT